ncbi:GNAT family N-acetyltransferase [Streptomyces spinoverrucosus]|uniref:GNAT family N-acetyltransferase n=1 Tax=Streptomyces spinoverrucosus TaxID=284043 RepID=UPI0018C3529A|nr:GNAT family N-acetyltransferase [Streptomyces spinoverrucosus]MBG0856464.1 GNAT family N-acetyltransferase [Streptomyces spinoverrucosus]
MTVIMRDLRPDVRTDLEAFARVRRLALPFMLATPESVAHHLTRTHPDAHFRSLVAEEDGEVVGTAQVSLAHDSPEPGQGSLNVYVHPERTRRGAGSLLVRAAEEHLVAHGATKLYSWVLDEPANRAFAERHGYGASRSAHFLRLDLAHRALPPLQDPPPGVELRTAADYADDPRPMFELDAETTSDEPSDIDTEFTDYEAWIEETWKHPLLDLGLTSVAVVDGRPAAFSIAYTDGTRYSTAMTGTARAFRGRGLAKLAKNASLHRARAAGYTEAFTGNDAGNGPMLAINKWFGYEICATEVRHVRERV